MEQVKRSGNAHTPKWQREDTHVCECTRMSIYRARYTRTSIRTYVRPLLPYGCQLPRLPLDKLGSLPTWRKMHGTVSRERLFWKNLKNIVRPDKTSAGIEHAQAKDSRVNCITAGGRLARTREIKSLASIFERLAYWAARSSHHIATRADRTVSRALV